MPTQNQYPSHHQKQTLTLISTILKPIFTLFILSTFLFIGIAAVSTVLLLLAGSSLQLCPRRRHHHNNHRRSSSTVLIEELQLILPQFNYDGGVEVTKDCAICLECFEDGEWCRRMMRCNHLFHVNCVDSWLVKVLNCPVCRSPVCFDSRASSYSIDENHENEDYKLWWAV